MRQPTQNEFIALSILAVLILLFGWRFYLNWKALNRHFAEEIKRQHGQVGSKEPKHVGWLGTLMGSGVTQLSTSGKFIVVLVSTLFEFTGSGSRARKTSGAGGGSEVSGGGGDFGGGGASGSF
jgi:uncharacterized membrane protein YgcG